MILILGLMLVCIIVNMRFHLKKGIDTCYVSKERTQTIKGIFTIFVFMSHARQYAAFSHVTDIMVIDILDYLGQLMVAPFLFYSGYGIFESIKRKGKQYVDALPTNRVGKTFFDFSIAIALFLIMNLLIEKSYSLKQIILSFTGWTSVGNSNWYMFAIFCLYILTYVSFKVINKNRFFALCLLTVLSLVYVYILSRVQPSRFSNTALCYVVGMWFSYFREFIEKVLQNYNWTYYLATILVVVLYLYCYPHKGVRIMYFNGVSILFCLCIVMLSMKVSSKSRVLDWFGQHLFWVYIIQRIPMIILSHLGVADLNRYIFLIGSFILTILMAKYINIGTTRLKQLVFAERR